jgi:hypothetical protein
MKSLPLALGSLALATAFTALPAHAGSTVLTLTRVSLTNVDDAAGRFQHEGGKIFKGAVQVGQYAITRRVTLGGTNAPLNTAMQTTTLFFAASSGSAPQNVTLQGAHDFSSGSFRGSVSAASNRYNWLQGGDAVSSVPSAGTQTLVMSWTGASQLTLP